MGFTGEWAQRRFPDQNRQTKVLCWWYDNAGLGVRLGTTVIWAWPSFLVWSPPWYCNRYLLSYKQTNKWTITISIAAYHFRSYFYWKIYLKKCYESSTYFQIPLLLAKSALSCRMYPTAQITNKCKFRIDVNTLLLQLMWTEFQAWRWWQWWWLSSSC